MGQHNPLIAQAAACLVRARRPGQDIHRVIEAMQAREALFRQAGVETQITATKRWSRVKVRGEMEWDQVDCFQFTDPDGVVSYADGLSPEQSDTLARQEVERGSLQPALAAVTDEMDALVAQAGF